MDELVKQLREQNAHLCRENELLRQKVDALIRRLFGSKSESLSPDQLQLLLAELTGDEPGPSSVSAAEPPAETEKTPRQARPRHPRIPDHLPVVEEILDPEPVQACPEAWRCIGQEVSEQLDYTPGRFVRRRMVRRKYVKRSAPDQAPIIAPLPPKVVERGLMAPGLLAQVVTSKYADHLPLYRQEWIYRQRHGVELPRQTLSRGVRQVAEWLQPIVREMSREQFAGGYVQVDETPIRYLEPGAGKAPQGYLWTAHVPGGDTVYHWHVGRGHQCLETIVPAGFSGVVQCDGYGAYRTFARKRRGIELAGCWAHVRRKFYDAWELRDHTDQSGWMLERIGGLYRIEEQLRRSRAGPDDRRQLRQTESRLIVDEIHRGLVTFKTSRAHLPQSLMGKAVDYALGQWPTLELWLEDGRLEIDNNLVENAIRPTAIGKKNWLFFGGEEPGWVSAAAFSVITSCRNRGIDPHAYLKHVLERLPSMTNHQIPDITPAAWSASATAASSAAA
jgi:transposase